MKLDIHSKDFDTSLFGRVTVTLDGVEQDRVTVADEEAGYIIQHAVDDDGRLRTMGDDDPHVATVCRSGRVRITIKDDAIG